MKTSEEEHERLTAFQRNGSLEELLLDLNGSLICAEKFALSNCTTENKNDYPVVFIMGPHRSGSTLLMQWLANSGLVAYPSNLLPRFYSAPVIGAMIQLMLTDSHYNFRDEILEFNSQILFESDNGKTKGALAPNEFWYFWRRFLPYQDIDWLPDAELFNVVNVEMLVNELTSLTRIFDKPFALKSMILNYNIPFLDEIFKKALFIQIKRDPVSNVASILEARRRQLGNDKEWYSFKIPEYQQLKKLDPVTQASGQYHYINSAVTKGMKKVSDSRKMIIKYESFCESPRKIYEELVIKLNINENNFNYNGAERFKISRSEGVRNRSAIEKALLHFKTIKTA